DSPSRGRSRPCRCSNCRAWRWRFPATGSRGPGAELFDKPGRSPYRYRPVRTSVMRSARNCAPGRRRRLAKALVIVESPAKAKTINKFLGRDYIVKASMGHVRDLPKSKLGVDEDKNFAPQYTLLPAKKKTIEDLKKAAEKADNVYLAADPDRE